MHVSLVIGHHRRAGWGSNIPPWSSSSLMFWTQRRYTMWSSRDGQHGHEHASMPQESTVLASVDWHHQNQLGLILLWPVQSINVLGSCSCGGGTQLQVCVLKVANKLYIAFVAHLAFSSQVQTMVQFAGMDGFWQWWIRLVPRDEKLYYGTRQRVTAAGGVARNYGGS